MRVDRMMEEGLEQEAASLIRYRGLNALNTVGYREMFRWFDGEVSKVDTRAQELIITEQDPITEDEEATVISILSTTKFSGVKSLKEIKTGDEVSVEVSYDELSDSWQAISVEVAGAGA